MMLRPSGCWATSHDAPGTSPSLPSFPYVCKCYYYMCVFTDTDVKMCYKNEIKLNYTTKLLLTARESAGHQTSNICTMFSLLKKHHKRKIFLISSVDNHANISQSRSGEPQLPIKKIYTKNETIDLQKQANKWLNECGPCAASHLCSNNKRQ